MGAMKPIRTTVGLLCTLVISACSLLPDPDPYPTGVLDAAVVVDASPPAEDIFIPPVTGQQMLDADVDQGVIPDARPPRMQDAAVQDMGTPTCAEQCTVTEDCLPEHECRDAQCVRADAFDLCQDQDFCVAAQSRWLLPCQSNGDCDSDFACIRVGEDQGRCAPRASEFDCEGDGRIGLPRMSFADDGELVTVCTQSRAICRDGNCMLKCQMDADCGNTQLQHPVCDVESGRCVCTAESCTRNASVCSEDGRCECVVDGDCTEGADRCFAGQCGCSSPEICAEPLHPGTTVVCAP